MAISASTLGVVPAAPAPPTRGGLAAGTRVLLEAPIPGTLLRLAAPNVVVIAVQAAINVLEAVYVGWLGRDALAGIALVFPLVMLMQTMSAGGMGVGIASAIARALGGGRRRDADALVLHGLLIALAFAAAFTVGMLWGGPRLYRAMGGTDGVLAAEPRGRPGARGPPARGVVPRHPPGGAAGRAQHGPDEPRGRGPHGSRRRLRHGGAGRLRHRRPPRISADPPRVRTRLGAGDD